VPRIEPAGPHDLPGAYRVCLATGDAGRDATTLHRDPDLLGHVHVGPYLARGTDTQLVVVDAGGVAGNLLSADDTPAFAVAQDHDDPYDAPVHGSSRTLATKGITRSDSRNWVIATTPSGAAWAPW
jgi:hypothetical protein